MPEKDGMTQEELKAFGWVMEKTIGLSQQINNTYIGVLEHEVNKRREAMADIEPILYDLLDEVARNSEAGFLVRAAIKRLVEWNDVRTE